MIVSRIELVDFRNYESATFDLTDGVTAVVGRNGQGKTNLAEALAYLATLSSFRGAPPEALIRVGSDLGIIRATVREDDGREILIEAELARAGRNRVQVNRQRLAKTRDLLGSMRVSVFAPDDLVLVKGGPAERRRFLDDTLVALATKYDSIRLELDRIVRQRNTLLKQANGKLTDEVAATLDVWDARFVAVGEPFGHARATLVARCQPMVVEAYEQLAGEAVAVDLAYEPAWRRDGLAATLTAHRNDDRASRCLDGRAPPRRRRDRAGRPARRGPMPRRGSSARSRSRCGSPRTGWSPSAPDPHRCSCSTTCCRSSIPTGPTALLANLPPGQVVITTASPLPAAAHPDRVLEIRAGTVVTA